MPNNPTPNCLIAAIDLSKTVGSDVKPISILKQLQLQIISGESVAIIGSSGSGKSTLLALLAGLDVPTGGEVLVEGIAFSRLDEDARAALRGRSMGFIFQSFQLLPTLTALENVMIPLQLALNPEAKSIAIEALTQVGLAHRLHHYSKQLSGGEQQRVAIARAFAARPAILFADEPTGNLDSVTGQQIIDLLFALNASYGTTLILVTHDAQLATRCQRTLTLKDGRLHDI